MSDIFNGTKTGWMDGGGGGSVYGATEMPLNFTDDTIGVLLASTATNYTFNAGDADYVGDLFDGGSTAEEFGGTGYTRSDGHLSGKSITEDNSNDRAEFDANDVTFSSLDGDEIQFAVVAKDPGDGTWNLGECPVIAYITSSDFPLTTNGGDVTISWAGEGIVHIS